MPRCERIGTEIERQWSAIASFRWQDASTFHRTLTDMTVEIGPRSILARLDVGAAGHIVQRSDLISRRIVVDQATLILVEEGASGFAGPTASASRGRVRPYLSTREKSSTYPTHRRPVAPTEPCGSAGAPSCCSRRALLSHRHRANAWRLMHACPLLFAPRSIAPSRP